MTEKPVRTLLVTRNLPPLVGGMERLNWHIADQLALRGDVRVLAPEGSAALRPTHVQMTEVPLRPLWRFISSSAWQALRIARDWKPDVVLAGSGLTAPAALAAARASGARSAVYLHGLDAAVQHPIYRTLWHPAIRRMDTVIANSQTTANLAVTLGISTTSLHIVPPGVQLPEAAQSPSALQDFRHRHGLGQARLMLSIGRLTTRKGLREFVQHALPHIVQGAPDTLLLVIGDAPTDSLHASVQTRDSIQSVADTAGIGHHLRFLGVVTDPHELACAYECATLHIFPVRHLPGDPEGFGMVAIEAAAHGVPTIAFSTGGIVDAVSPGQSGSLVTPEDYPALSKAVLHVLQSSEAPYPNCATFARNFAWPEFGTKLLRALYAERISTPSATI